ncbi:MAG: FAD-dependent oxidoreductase [Lysobacterales bacterium]
MVHLSQAPRSIADTSIVSIVGAGLAGSLLAIYLARRGFQVEIFERGADPRETGNATYRKSEGRSINLALAQRGISALQRIGLHHRVGQFALPMSGRMVHVGSTPPVMLPYGQRPGEVIYSVHREQLNQALLDAAENTRRVRCHFRQELKSLDLSTSTACFHDHASGRDYLRSAAPVIGADGVGSTVRGAIDQATGGQTHSHLLEHGYREYGIAPTASGDFALASEALHIWPRGDFMLIALPNTDGSFTATAFMANKGPDSFASLNNRDAEKAFLQTHFADIADKLQAPNTEQAPVGVLGSLSCEHWFHEHRAVILGDAAHAIVPFHGQGMNCAFEDVEEFDRCLSDTKTWDEAFHMFQHRRKDNARAIAEMAMENYLEMRSAVADPAYRLRRQLEQALEKRFPRRFVPRYSLVMFRQVDYRRAQKRGQINLGILQELTRNITQVSQVDWVLAEHLVAQRLTPLDP